MNIKNLQLRNDYTRPLHKFCRLSEQQAKSYLIQIHL